MTTDAYNRGYQKAKFYQNGGAASAPNRPATGSTNQPGTTTATGPVATAATADISEERGRDLVLDFATEYNGREWGFLKSPDNKGPDDLFEFIEEGKVPRQGDLIHSNDNYLYVLGGPELHESLKVGWYRSVGQVGPPPAPSE